MTIIEYSANMLETNQLINALSIDYGNNIFKGGCGTGKTTILLSRAIKLARVLPTDNRIPLYSYLQKDSTIN